MAFRNNDFNKTAPAQQGFDESSDNGATSPASFGGEASVGGAPFGETMPGAFGPDVGPTQKVNEGYDPGVNARVDDYSDATKPVSVGGVEGFSPVVGWLVCIEGPAEGTDYRIRAGYNYIGRGENMDVCIQGDNTIGRDRHAMIAYDPQEKIFFFGPADGRSIVRKNEKMVMVPTELAAFDVVRIGSTKLMFVPLCGEHFNWKDEQFR